MLNLYLGNYFVVLQPGIYMEIYIKSTFVQKHYRVVKLNGVEETLFNILFANVNWLN